MNSYIKRVVDKSKETLSYLSDLGQVVSMGWALFITAITFLNNSFTVGLRNKLQEMNLLSKITLTLFLFFMLYYLINNTYRKLKFIVEIGRFTSSLENEKSNQMTGQLISSYENIIPSTNIIKEIFQTLDKVAKKWSKDSYLAGQELKIWIKKDNISVEMTVEFFSARKKASLKLRTIGMRVSEKISITPNQISYDDYRVNMKPFFFEKKWREFVVEGLERLEKEIAGHELYITVSSDLGSVRFYVDPGFVPHRSFAFHLNNGVMYQDMSLGRKVVKL